MYTDSNSKVGSPDGDVRLPYGRELPFKHQRPQTIFIGALTEWADRWKIDPTIV